MRTPTLSLRTLALAACLVGGAAFLLLAWRHVPWSPVPGGIPAPVAATSLFTDAEIERAESFSRLARVWSWSSLAMTLVLLASAGLTRLGDVVVARLPGPWWCRVVLGVAVLLIGVRVLTLPFAFGAWRLRVDRGLSTQNLGEWALDLAKSEMLEILITAGLALILVGAARRFRVWWPIVAATCLGALVVLGSFIYPLLVEPVFNEFEPLPAGALRTAITQAAHHEGVAIEDVVVADASRRTTTLNAWVSGLGRTRRVVLYDNLVEEVPQDQVMTVVAHELAHAKHADVLVGTSLGAAGVVLGVGLLALVLPGMSRGREVSDPRVVPLLLVVLAVGAQLSAPVQNAISRKIETRADVTALHATQDPVAFEELQRQLAVRSLADPTPPEWSQWWWGSHPGVLTRVAVARQADRESAGS